MSDQILKELEEKLAALEPGGAAVKPSPEPQAKQEPASEMSQILARLKRETSAEAEEHYLQTHKACAVCLRHNVKDAVACELCKTNGPEWLPVTDPHPTWYGGAFTREYLSNVRSYTSPFDVRHLRWMLNWKHEPKQINAALFVDQGYVLTKGR